MEPCLKLQDFILLFHVIYKVFQTALSRNRDIFKSNLFWWGFALFCSVIVAITEADSTVVYHKLLNGLVPPDPPEKIEEKQKQRERQFRRKQNRFVDLKTTTLSRTEPASTVTYEPYKTDNSHKGKDFVPK